MKKSTPSKTVRKVLLDYSSEHKDQTHSRSRSRDKDKDKHKRRQKPGNSRDVELMTKGKCEQLLEVDEGIPEGAVKEAYPVPLEELEEELPELVIQAPLTLAKEEKPTNEETEAVDSTKEEAGVVGPRKDDAEEEFIPQEIQMPTESQTLVEGSGSVEDVNTRQDAPDIKNLITKKSSANRKSVFSKIKIWITGKQSRAGDKDRLSIAEEGKEENVDEANDKVQEEEAPPGTAVLKSSLGTFSSTGSFIPDEEASTILDPVSDKDTDSLRDVVGKPIFIA